MDATGPSEPTGRADPPAATFAPPPPSRYESQKRRDWNTFLQYLRTHQPPVSLPQCGGAHVIEFLKYLDRFGKTKVHEPGCAHFGRPESPDPPCPCPLNQAWGSLDALVGRLRAAHDERRTSGEVENPFADRAVGVYLREVKERQGKARGVAYRKRWKRKRVASTAAGSSAGADKRGGSSSSSTAAGDSRSSSPAAS
ncbi:protein G1-like7 [Zingiber officinale]|uniref:ALOG domain-containing protein n=1 Tax=Zingiber officinale TaxID=94328 RepID=A0A8J5LRC1_ZINOF|nr:protein G1-like7 [Zingiber officinale]KAG6535319.1 hypothetical protein ZIOFF_000284 [Zingiber officinale]